MSKSRSLAFWFSFYQPSPQRMVRPPRVYGLIQAHHGVSSSKGACHGMVWYGMVWYRSFSNGSTRIKAYLLSLFLAHISCFRVAPAVVPGSAGGPARTYTLDRTFDLASCLFLLLRKPLRVRVALLYSIHR